jgi:hypothetical protein
MIIFDDPPVRNKRTYDLLTRVGVFPEPPALIEDALRVVFTWRKRLVSEFYSTQLDKVIRSIQN